MAPRDEPADITAEAALLEAFSEIPTVSGAWVHPAGPSASTLTVQSNQRNVAANAQRKFLTHYSLPDGYSGEELQPSFPVELKDVALLSVSPSGRRTFVVRAGGDGKSASLEVWGGGRLLKDLQVPKTLHGGIYNDGWFGAGAAWSPDEGRLAYVAEAPPKAQTPLWGDSGSKASPSSDADGVSSSEQPGGDHADSLQKQKGGEDAAAPQTWRGVGEFQEDWGELNTGKRPPTLFVLDLASWRLSPVSGLPPDSSVGQPVWTPKGDGLVCVAWPHTAPNFPAFPQRLGIVYCFNRPCALWAAAAPDTSAEPSPRPSGAGSGGLDGLQPAAGDQKTDSTNGAADADDQQPKAVRLTAEAQLQSAFSPRFAPDGGRLLFLSQHAACVSGVHNGTTSVHALEWSQSDSSLEAASAAAAADAQVVLPVVESPSSRDAFPGLYTTGLPPQPFLGGGWLVANSQWRSSAAIIAVDVATGTASRLSPNDGAAWSLLDHSNGWLVATSSRPEAPARLHVARAPAAGSDGNDGVRWQPVRAAADVSFHPRVEEALQDMEAVVLDLAPGEGDGGQAVPFQAVVVRPRSAPGPAPTVLLPHGGPHAAFVAAYVSPVAFLTALGYVVVAPNFRGSTGFGEALVQALPGRAGTDDVADCLTALHASIEHGWTDPKRVAIVGGSHGGFLTGHLVGQHPEAFAAAVLRNPVLDLSAMQGLSDIPDWCYIEAWGTEEGKKRMAARPSAEDLARFREVSPIAHAGRVTAPLLFLLGAKDRRVPLTDAHLYVRELKSRGGDAPETRVIVFPEDTHALDRTQTEFEQWANVAAWLKRHLGTATVKF